MRPRTRLCRSVHAHWEAVEWTLRVHLSGTPDPPSTHIEASSPSEGYTNANADGSSWLCSRTPDIPIQPIDRKEIQSTLNVQLQLYRFQLYHCTTTWPYMGLQHKRLVHSVSADGAGGFDDVGGVVGGVVGVVGNPLIMGLLVSSSSSMLLLLPKSGSRGSRRGC